MVSGSVENGRAGVVILPLICLVAHLGRTRGDDGVSAAGLLRDTNPLKQTNRSSSSRRNLHSWTVLGLAGFSLGSGRTTAS